MRGRCGDGSLSGAVGVTGVSGDDALLVVVVIQTRRRRRDPSRATRGAGRRWRPMDWYDSVLARRVDPENRALAIVTTKVVLRAGELGFDGEHGHWAEISGAMVRGGVGEKE